MGQDYIFVVVLNEIVCICNYGTAHTWTCIGDCTKSACSHVDWS